MAETFCNLALIYIAIILSAAGYYYLSKAIASRKQRTEKEEPINQSAIVDEPTTITTHPNNSALVSITTENEITDAIKAIEKIAEPGIKIIQHSPGSIALINGKDNTIINQTNETHEQIADEATTITAHQNSIVPVSAAIENEVAETIHSINIIADAEIEIQHSPDSIAPINEKDNTTLNQLNEPYKPQLTLLKQNTKIGKGVNGGLIKTIYYFGCEDGYSIINPTIEIIFNNRFADISGGITSAGFVVTRYLSKKSLEDNKRFVITVDFLQAYTYIFIQTISRQHLQIENLEIIA